MFFEFEKKILQSIKIVFHHSLMNCALMPAASYVYKKEMMNRSATLKESNCFDSHKYYHLSLQGFARERD
jgi:hypothetical protein